jgi:hypothetical protein
MKRRRCARESATAFLGVAVSGLAAAVASAGVQGCSLVAGLDEFNGAVAQEIDAAPSDSSPSFDAPPAEMTMGYVRDSAGGGEASTDPLQRDDAGAPPPIPDASAGTTDGGSNPVGGGDGGHGGSGGDAPDSRTDATAEANAHDAGTWCSSHASATTLDCHDFDEGQPPQSGFASHYFSGHYASVTATDYAPGSPPAALLVTTPQIDAGGPSQDEQFNDVLGFRTKVELSFDLKIVNYDPTAGDVSLFRLSYQGGGWATQFDLHQNGASFTESNAGPDGGAEQTTYVAAQPSALDAWTNVDCLIDFGNHTMSLWYNGVPIITNQAIRNPDQNKPMLFVQTGLNYLVAPAKPMMIYYDDILLSAPP